MLIEEALRHATDAQINIGAGRGGLRPCARVAKVEGFAG